MAVTRVKILVLDADPASRQTLRHLLDCEGWLMHFVEDPRSLLNELAVGDWSLVLASIDLAPPGGPVFSILRDLSRAEIFRSSEQGGARAMGAQKREEGDPVERRLGILFVVPADAAGDYLPCLERDRLPYAIRPYHVQDFFEKISDLLIEVGAIPKPLRTGRFQGAHESSSASRDKGGRSSSMFASRRDYMMSEEEIAEYERQEAEELKKKKKRLRGE